MIYLHDAGGDNLELSGLKLRQLAELGVGAVGVECNLTNKQLFDAQFSAVLDYVRKQSWAMSNAFAWCGYGAGAQQMLRFASMHPEYRPQLLICVAGGDTSGSSSSDINTDGSFANSHALVLCGGDDAIFPVSSGKKLAENLRSRGAVVDFCVLNGIDHFFRPNQDLVWRAVAEYSASHLGLTGIPVASREESRWYYWLPILILIFLLVWRGRPISAEKLRDRAPTSKLAKTLLLFGTCLSAVVVLEACLMLILPLCRASGPVRLIARQLLVKPGLLEDFDFLVGSGQLGDKRLGDLLQHVEIANLQRNQFYIVPNERFYREFILCPTVGASGAEQWDWRRRLWEACYPRVRNETKPMAAATTIVRFLREHVTIDSKVIEREGVESCWKSGVADEPGFEELYTAALRSVGIAARVGQQGRTELWTVVEWKLAPRPLIESGFDFRQM